MQAFFVLLPPTVSPSQYSEPIIMRKKRWIRYEQQSGIYRKNVNVIKIILRILISNIFGGTQSSLGSFEGSHWSSVAVLVSFKVLLILILVCRLDRTYLRMLGLRWKIQRVDSISRLTRPTSFIVPQTRFVLPVFLLLLSS